jgi:hypothetical protein
MMIHRSRSRSLITLVLATMLMSISPTQAEEITSAVTLDDAAEIDTSALQMSVASTVDVIYIKAPDVEADAFVLVSTQAEVTYDPGTAVQRAGITATAPLMAPALFAQRHFTEART